MLNIVDRKPSSLNELCKLYKHKTQRLGVKKKGDFSSNLPIFNIKSIPKYCRYGVTHYTFNQSIN